jgi:integrase
MGLSEDVQKRIWEVTEPNSPENPWRGEHNRIRNGLIIRWFFALGLRRGELLGVGIRHIDFRKNTVVIVRRADDKNDPRRNQPNAKTLDRELPMSDDLVKRTHEYILKYRRNQRKAKSHQFLFVANGGAPLGLRQVNRIFETLRKRCPELPDEIFPHLLRHTWNDNFSIEMDAQEIKAEHEQKMRSRLMGWSPTSKTAALYTRRHTQRAARKASLGLQEKMVKPKHD